MRELGLNPSAEELQDLVNEADLNKDGVISFDGACRGLPTYLPTYLLLTYLLYLPTYLPTFPTHLSYPTYLSTDLPTYLPTSPTYLTYLPTLFTFLTYPTYLPAYPLTRQRGTEFLALMSQSVKEMDSEQELLNAFRVFDKDGSGTISSDELRNVLRSLGEDLTDQELDDMLKLADRNGDGQIDCESRPHPSRVSIYLSISTCR